jgi:DNA-binding response OmpR family regulator
MTNDTSRHAINLVDCDLYLNGSSQAIRLRRMEVRLMAVLLRHRNRVVSRATLMHKVWETDFLGDTRTLDVHICWLRRKIEADPAQPRRLVTVRGVGYCLVVDD